MDEPTNAKSPQLAQADEWADRPVTVRFLQGTGGNRDDVCVLTFPDLASAGRYLLRKRLMDPKAW